MSESGLDILTCIYQLESFRSAVTQLSMQECLAIECDGTHGYLPDPSDCGSFYMCSYGNPYRMPCLAGLVFNPDLMVCDHPSSYDCKETC